MTWWKFVVSRPKKTLVSAGCLNEYDCLKIRRINLVFDIKTITPNNFEVEMPTDGSGGMSSR